MAVFSRKSRAALDTCDDRLIRVAQAAIAGSIDFAILQGHRSEREQAELVAAGRSKTMKSKHLTTPSQAFDFAPYVAGIGILTGAPEQIDSLCERFHLKPAEADGYIREQYTLVAGLILGAGQALGIQLRWGGDWDSDGDTLDNRFDDLGHIELAE